MKSVLFTATLLATAAFVHQVTVDSERLATAIAEHAYEVQDEPPDSWHDDHCHITAAHQDGRTYWIRTSRTDRRRVCLAGNPDGCEHVLCGGDS